VRRDIAERGRDIDGVLKQYTKFVKPSFEDYIQPSKKYADSNYIHFIIYKLLYIGVILMKSLYKILIELIE